MKQQAELALKHLQSTSEDEYDAIHEARKCFKRLRACYLLLKPTDKSASLRGNKFFRELAVALSTQRDSQVQYKLLEELCAAHPHLEELSEARQLTQVLMSEIDQHKAVNREIVASVCDELEHYLQKRRYELATPPNLKAVLLGMRDNYIDCRKMWKKAFQLRTGESFHDWRKRVKNEFYYTQLLSKSSEERRRVKSLDKLGELLGEYHDRSLLQWRLKEMEIDNSPLFKVTVRQQKKLLSLADKEARRLFDVKGHEHVKLLSKRVQNTFESH